MDENTLIIKDKKVVHANREEVLAFLYLGTGKKSVMVLYIILSKI